MTQAIGLLWLVSISQAAAEPPDGGPAVPASTQPCVGHSSPLITPPFDAPSIVDPQAATDLAGGQIKAAITTYRQLFAGHPSDPTYHEHFACLLLDVAAGDAARAEATRATELAPESADAWILRGWMLEHDSFSRWHYPGMDVPGAIDAYEKAIALAPQQARARRALVHLLVVDGEQHGPPPQPQFDQAIDQLRRLRSVVRSDEDETLLLKLLLRQGLYEEVAKVAASADSSPEKLALVIAANARRMGPDLAAVRARHQIKDDVLRRQALWSAAHTLLELRSYVEAARLIQASAAGRTTDAAASSDDAAFWATTSRYEVIPVNPDDPVLPALRLFAIAAEAVAPSDDSQRLLASHVPQPPSYCGSMDPAECEQGFPARDADIVLSHRDVRTEGMESAGYRVTITSTVPGALAAPLHVFVVRRGNEYRAVATEYVPERLGDEILGLIDRNDLAGARQWLEWAREVPSVAHDELFAWAWHSGNRPALPTMRLAAAVLAVNGDRADDAIQVLKEAASSPANAAWASKLRLRLAQAYLHARDYEDVLLLTKPLVNADPTSNEAFVLEDQALSALGRARERAAVAQARLSRLPGDPLALIALIESAADTDDCLQVDLAGWEAMKAKPATAEIYDPLVWLTLCCGLVSPQFLTDATHVTWPQPPPIVSADAAALQVEAGNLSEARKLLFASLDAETTGRAPPGDVHWYVLGRLLEQYGLNADAVAAYRRIPTDDAARRLSVAHAAARRLKLLGASGK